MYNLYRENLRSITSETVWSCLIWVQTVASPQYFCVTFRTNCSVKICLQGYKLQQAKLNLIMSHVCLTADAGFVYVIFDTTKLKNRTLNILYSQVGVTFMSDNPISNDAVALTERYRNSFETRGHYFEKGSALFLKT